MMSELMKIVTEATDKERSEAYAAHGDLHSHNEGYGVLAEEIDEVQEEIRNMMHYFDRLMRVIRNNLRELGSDLGQIRRNAQLAACECIQVAAVAQRFLDLIEKEKRADAG
jgi:hypothetical protein